MTRRQASFAGRPERESDELSSETDEPPCPRGLPSVCIVQMMKPIAKLPAFVAMVVSATSAVACSKPSTDAAQDNSATAATTAMPAAAAAPAQSDPADTPDQTATAAPPPPQAENPGPAPTPNDVWAGGSWQFEQGRFVWAKGHWEGRHEGQFQQARWVQVNGRWEHHPARWIVGRAEARPVEPRLVEPRPGEPRPLEPRPGEPRPIERR